MKTCKLFGKREYAFMYKGIVNKYRVDMAAFHTTYMQLRGFAGTVNDFLEQFVLYPVDEGLPSILDMTVCSAAFIPCSAKCMPIIPCKRIVEDAIKKFDKHRHVKNVLNADCQNLADFGFDKEVLSLGGLGEGVAQLLYDVLRGLSESCESFHKYVFEGTNIDDFASSLCMTFSNYSAVWS